MEYVALVTLLLVLQYLTFMMLCGAARAKGNVQAPAVTGDETFERAYRVQMNTAEQLFVALPALWLSAMYFMPMLAAGLGLVFFLGRMMYRIGYMKDPAKRGPGMMLGMLANLGLIGTALWGIISAL
jgi:glutathione S-transferase